MAAETYSQGDLPEGLQGQQTVSESAKEAFSEGLKKTQAAQKKAKITEQKARTYDDTLARLVTNLLQTGGEDELVKLIIAVVACNVPSDLVLAILSLEFDEAYARAEKNAQQQTDTSSLVQNVNSLDVHFASGPEAQEIKMWIERVTLNAFKDASQVLETIIHVESWQIQPMLLHLTTLVLQRFLARRGQDASTEDIQAFNNQLFTRLQEQLQKAIL